MSGREALGAAPAAGAERARRGGSVAEVFARFGTILGLAGLIVFFSLASPVFLRVQNVTNILTASAILGVVATGLTVVLVIMQFDLSVGYTATAAGMLAAGVAQSYGTLGGGVAALAIGALVGVANGLVVSRLGVSAFIATLAMGQILAGWLLAYRDGTQIQYGLPDDFETLGTGKIGPLPLVVLLWFASVAVVWIFLERTPLGRRLYAVGANPVAARMSGIRIGAIQMVAFVLCGALCGIAGLMLASSIGAGNSTAGLGYLLPAFASCFIGAATLRSGQFHVVGTLVGVLVLGVLQNGLILVGVSPAWSTAAQGLVLIGAVALSGTFSRLVSR